MLNNDTLARRDVLSTAGALGALSIAGCMGGGEDEERVTVGTAGEGSSTFAAAQALQRAISQEGEGVVLDAQTTQGYVSNVRLYDSGEVPAIGLDNYTAVQAAENEGPYADDPVDSLPMQGFQFSTINMYPMAVDGTGIETTSDLEGRRVWPIEAGNATRLLTEDVLREAGLWEELEIVEVGGSDLAGAVEEGQVEAFIADPSGYVDTLPGEIQEVDTRNDLHAVEVEDFVVEAIHNIDGIGYQELDEVRGWNQDIGADMLRTWTLNGQFWFGDEVSADAVQEICRVSHEHIDTVRDSDPAYLDHSDIENMTAAFSEDFPIHPGAANFFQEQDAWNDSWTAGEGN